MSPHPDPLPRFIYQYRCSSAGRGNGRGAMPFLMSFALEHEIVTFAWIDNASVQFPLNIYATKELSTAAGRNRSTPSPREARTGRGFPSWANNPPLPGPLLPWWEERERSNRYARSLT